jgi:SAF domain
MISSKRKATDQTGGGEFGDRFDAIIASSGLAARKAKPRVIGAGAGLIIAGGLAGALMFGSGRDAHQVLVASHPIDAGTVLTTADMRGVSVSGQIGFRSTSSTEMGLLVGKVASVPIPAGSLVVAEQLQLRQSAPPGTVLVGMVLDPGALPSPDLRFGDLVQVLATTNPNAVIDEPATVMTEATVWKVWGGNEGSGRRVVTLAVPSKIATEVGDAASRNLIRLLVVPTEQTAPTDTNFPVLEPAPTPTPTTTGAGS